MITSSTKNGWFTVIGETPPQELLDIPGIKSHELTTDLHWTTWKIPSVLAWFVDLGVTPNGYTDTILYRAPAYETLYPHQKYAVEWLLARRGGLLCDQMGLGKTASTIVAAESYDPNGLKVIVGPTFVRDVWRRELLRLGVIRHPDEYAVLSGRDNTKPYNRGAKWIFAHYDIVAAWWPRIAVRRPSVGILDEAHYAKGAKAARTRGAAVAVGVCPFRIVITGTPIMNRLSEFWSLLDIAGGSHGFGTSFAFRERYCGLHHTGYGYADGSPTHVAELTARLSSVYLRRTSDTAGLQLPPLTRSTLSVELSPEVREEQAALLEGYHTSMEHVYETLSRGVASTDTLKLLSLLRKLTAMAKLATTAEAVASTVDQGESAVVFVWERATANKLASRISQRVSVPVYTIHGGASQDEREKMIAAFQAGGGVIVATIDSLGAGVTLTRARFVYMHDLDWTPADLLQAEGRVYRIGQTQACQSIWVVVENSIDEIFARMLVNKADVTAAVLGDRVAQDVNNQVGFVALAERAFEAAAEQLAYGGFDDGHK